MKQTTAQLQVQTGDPLEQMYAAASQTIEPPSAHMDATILAAARLAAAQMSQAAQSKVDTKSAVKPNLAQPNRWLVRLRQLGESFTAHPKGLFATAAAVVIGTSIAVLAPKHEVDDIAQPQSSAIVSTAEMAKRLPSETSSESVVQPDALAKSRSKAPEQSDAVSATTTLPAPVAQENRAMGLRLPGNMTAQAIGQDKKQQSNAPAMAKPQAAALHDVPKPVQPGYAESANAKREVAAARSAPPSNMVPPPPPVAAPAAPAAIEPMPPPAHSPAAPMPTRAAAEPLTNKEAAADSQLARRRDVASVDLDKSNNQPIGNDQNRNAKLAAPAQNQNFAQNQLRAQGSVTPNTEQECVRQINLLLQQDRIAAKQLFTSCSARFNAAQWPKDMLDQINKQ